MLAFFCAVSICVYSGSGSYCLPLALASICFSNEKGLVRTPRLCCNCQRRASRIDFVLRMVFANMKAQITPRSWTNATVKAPVAIKIALFSMIKFRRGKQPYLKNSTHSNFWIVSFFAMTEQQLSGTIVLSPSFSKILDQSAGESIPQHSN